MTENILFMPLSIALIFGLLGLFLGSFANVVSLRLHSHKKGILFGRSACPKCHHQLNWYENLPLVSWICLRGKCLNCKTPISWQYPAVELFFGSLFFLVAFFSPTDDLLLLFWKLVIAFSLGILTVSDIRYMDIPDPVSLPTIAFLLIFSIFGSDVPHIPSLSEALLGAGIVYGFLSLFVLMPGILAAAEKGRFRPIKDAIESILLLPIWILFSLVFLGKYFEKKMHTEKDTEELPSWIGGGDLRLAIIMGLILGWKMGLVALFLAYFLGAVVMLPLYYIAEQKKRKAKKKRKKTKEDSLFPFGPFLAAGTILSIFWGQEILDWYFHLIGL